MPEIASRTLPRLIGPSAAVRALDRAIDDAARSEAPVIITGETGAGKDVVARLVHDRSPRTAGGLITIGCAGVPDAVLEAELFGHPRGAPFTGRDARGLFESVPHGTVLLDEVAGMSPRMQAVLLRFLESDARGDGRLIGRNARLPRPRLISTTNRDLPSRIAAGAFRDDLYFRLNGLTVRVPPLRDRAEDIPQFVAHYTAQFAAQYRRPAPAFGPDALAALAAYRWPGNVRELRQLVEQVVLAIDHALVSRADLPEPYRSADAHGPAARPGSMASVVAQMIERGESFWSTVYPAFMSHDLTRGDLREIVRAGLESTRGSYRALLERFNMPTDDYRRFVTFLHQHDCHLRAYSYDERPPDRLEQRAG